MNGNDYIPAEDILALLVTQLATKGLDRISGVRADLALTPDTRWIPDLDLRTLIVEFKRWPAVPHVVLPAMTVGGTTTMFPDLPADHLAEPRKLVISRQQFLIILITLIVLALPAAVLA
jgi:hypothetical protein